MKDAKRRLAKYADRVEEIENEGMDEGRFFVHLRDGWDFGTDPHNVRRSQSFGSAADAVVAVKAAKTV